MAFGKLPAAFSSAPQAGRGWEREPYRGELLNVGVRRKERGQVSQKDQIWIRKGKGGCHRVTSLGESHDKEA